MSPSGKDNCRSIRYYKVASGKEALLKLIAETEVAEQVYNSNAIENRTLSLEETEKIVRLTDMLEELDDVQNVYTNADISDEVLEKIN